MTSNQITIALTKGRIEKDTVKLLEKAGFDMSFMADKGRNLIFRDVMTNVSVFSWSKHQM